MKKNIHREAQVPTLEAKPPQELITESIENLEALRDHLSVAAEICAIEAKRTPHAFAIQDAIHSMMNFSNDSVDGCILSLEGVLEASRKESTS